jgi:hypothetical protein
VKQSQEKRKPVQKWDELQRRKEGPVQKQKEKYYCLRDQFASGSYRAAVLPRKSTRLEEKGKEGNLE